MAKGLMDEKQQSFIQQESEKLFPSTREGGRGDESRELHRVGAGESISTTKQLMQILVLQHRLPQNGRLQKHGDQKLVETLCKNFLHVKRSDFRFVTWFISILKFGLPQLLFEVFRTKTKTALF